VTPLEHLSLGACLLLVAWSLSDRAPTIVWVAAGALGLGWALTGATAPFRDAGKDKRFQDL
jgi:hypothetical protein